MGGIGCSDDSIIIIIFIIDVLIYIYIYLMVYSILILDICIDIMFYHESRILATSPAIGCPPSASSLKTP